MNSRVISSRRSLEHGFTMVELALTLCVLGIMTAMMIPKIGRVMQATRIRRQTAIVAADLEQVATLAARYRKPMRLSCACGGPNAYTYTVADLANPANIRLTRTLGVDSDLGRLTLNFAPSPVDFYPSGVSSAALTVTITSGSSTRTVTLSTAGLMRIQ
jgi:Tfp pilus assembly protein FimT